MLCFLLKSICHKKAKVGRQVAAILCELKKKSYYVLSHLNIYNANINLLEKKYPSLNLQENLVLF